MNITKKIEECKHMLTKLEQHEIENTMILIEILCNITLFGEINRSNCIYAEDEQCSYFNFEKKLITKYQ